METMTYHGVYDRAIDGTIWGRAPEFPGAFGAGDTLEEAQASLREGIRLWFEVGLELGHDDVTAMPDELVEIVDLSEMEQPPIAS
jgi:predicted RNase H-like HicB family nuclease